MSKTVYTGVIIEESLSDKSILSELHIISTEVESVTEAHATPWLEQWTLDTIEIPESEIDRVAERVSQSFDNEHISNWYADFKNDQFHYMIFPRKIFKLVLGKKSDYELMRDYGLSIGVPDYQIPSYRGLDDQELLTKQGVLGFAQRIAEKATVLKDKYTAEVNVPINYVCIFCQSNDEYEQLIKLVDGFGKVVEDHGTGPLFQIAPLETVAGQVKLLRIRRYDDEHPEWGDADFTLADYASFKQKYLGREGFQLIERPNFEMIELEEKNFMVRAYFSNPPIDKQLGMA